MVGKIGALRTAQVGPVEKAVEFALALISGWSKGEKEKFTAILTELRETAENNTKVYKQASDALNELSKREQAVRGMAAGAEKANRDAVDLTRRTMAEIAEARTKLDNDRIAFETSSAAKTLALQERDAELKARETAAKRAEKDIAAQQARQDARQAELDRLTVEAGRVKAESAATLTELAAIIARHR